MIIDLLKIDTRLTLTHANMLHGVAGGEQKNRGFLSTIVELARLAGSARRSPWHSSRSLICSQCLGAVYFFSSAKKEREREREREGERDRIGELWRMSRAGARLFVGRPVICGYKLADELLLK